MAGNGKVNHPGRNGGTGREAETSDCEEGRPQMRSDFGEQMVEHKQWELVEATV